MWYMGKTFDKEKNKPYKTLEGGLKAAEKSGMYLYDEDGKMANEATDERQEQQERPNDIDNQEQPQRPEEKMENILEQQAGNEPEEVHGKIKRIFNGKLRLRRCASWAPEAACGVTMFDEKEVTHRILVDGEPMYKTADGFYVSGKPEHVLFCSKRI